MIAKLTKSADFKRAADYLLLTKTNEPRGCIIGGNMIATNRHELAIEFEVSRNLRPATKRPVWHCSLSLHASKSLTFEAWDRAARVFMKEMGIDPDEHQWCLVLHTDTRNEHVHLLVSRIQVRDGKLAREQRGDYGRSHTAAAEAAYAVGLQPVEKLPSVPGHNGAAFQIKPTKSKYRQALDSNSDLHVLTPKLREN